MGLISKFKDWRREKKLKKEEAKLKIEQYYNEMAAPRVLVKEEDRRIIERHTRRASDGLIQQQARVDARNNGEKSSCNESRSSVLNMGSIIELSKSLKKKENEMKPEKKPTSPLILNNTITSNVRHSREQSPAEQFARRRERHRSERQQNARLAVGESGGASLGDRRRRRATARAPVVEKYQRDERGKLWGQQG